MVLAMSRRRLAFASASAAILAACGEEAPKPAAAPTTASKPTTAPAAAPTSAAAATVAPTVAPAAAAKAPATIQYWCNVGVADWQKIESAATAYGKANPSRKLTHRTAPEQDYGTKLITACAGRAASSRSKGQAGSQT